MASTLITVAPTGAEHLQTDVPQLPTTLDELVAEAKACQAAGAGLVHVHIRDADARPTLDLGRLKETVAALREGTDLVVQLSTGGSVHDPLDARLRVLEAAPDSCSLTCGTVNFGDDVFLNPWPFMVELYEAAREAQVVPEFELFDLGHVAALHRLLDTCGLPYGGKVHCDFVLGVPGGMPGTAQALVAGVQALPPQVTSWSATGIGRTHLPVLAAALSARWPPARRDGGQHRVCPRPAGAVERRARRARRPARHGAAATADVHLAGPRPARASLVVNGRRAGGAWPAGGARGSAGVVGMAVAVVALLALAVLAAATAGPAPRDPGRPIAVSLDPSATPGRRRRRPTTVCRAIPPRGPCSASRRRSRI